VFSRGVNEDTIFKAKDLTFNTEDSQDPVITSLGPALIAEHV